MSNKKVVVTIYEEIDEKKGSQFKIDVDEKYQPDFIINLLNNFSKTLEKNSMIVQILSVLKKEGKKIVSPNEVDFDGILSKSGFNKK